MKRGRRSSSMRRGGARTSGGIYDAVRSGIHAADAIASHLGGDVTAIESYATELATRFSRDLVRRRDTYRHEQRFPDSPFWARRSAGARPFHRETENTHEK